jgi:hypothetical protein
MVAFLFYFYIQQRKKMLSLHVFPGNDEKARTTVRNLLKKKMCGYEMNTEYFANHKSTRIVFGKVGKRFEAFALLKDGFNFQTGGKGKARDTVYIDLICGGPYMKILMAEMLAMFKREGLKYVTLSALPNVILWYKKLFGFNLSFSCTESKAHQRALDAIMKRKKVYSTQEVLTDSQFQKFLKQLSKQNLSFAKTMNISRCDNSYDPDNSNSCVHYGYFMKLCLDSQSARVYESTPKKDPKKTALVTRRRSARIKLKM